MKAFLPQAIFKKVFGTLTQQEVAGKMMLMPTYQCRKFKTVRTSPSKRGGEKRKARVRHVERVKRQNEFARIEREAFAELLVGLLQETGGKICTP